MRNARCLACCDTCQRRQNARVEPRRVERCEGGQLLGTRRQQDAPRSVCQIRGGPGGIGQHHTARGQGAGGAQQTVIFNSRRRCRRTDIARCLGGIRVGRVNAERRTAQQRRHSFGVQPPGAHRDAVSAALFLGPQLCRHTDRDRRAERRQHAGEAAPLRCTAENHHIHTPRYPLGVAILPCKICVAALPTKTVVNISTAVSSSSASVSSRAVWPSRPMQRTTPQRVPAPLPLSRRMRTGLLQVVGAAPGGRDCTAPAQKSPVAAQASRFSMISHGVSRSDSEITQKSCANGAPSTAAPLKRRSGRARPPPPPPGSPPPAPTAGWPCRRPRHRRSRRAPPSCRPLRGFQRPAAAVKLPRHAGGVDLFFRVKRAHKVDVDRIAAQHIGACRASAPGRSKTAHRRGRGPPHTQDYASSFFHLQSGAKGASGTAKVTPSRAHFGINSTAA